MAHGNAPALPQKSVQHPSSPTPIGDPSGGAATPTTPGATLTELSRPLNKLHPHVVRRLDPTEARPVGQLVRPIQQGRAQTGQPFDFSVDVLNVEPEMFPAPNLA